MFRDVERTDIKLITRTITWLAVIIGVFAMGMVSGRTYQHMKSGYQFRLIDEKEIPFLAAPVRLQHAFKSVGLGFVTLDSSILILDDPHCGKVTLYEARHGFQESYPYVKEVKVNDNELSWNDGRYMYQLRIDLLASKASNPKVE